MMFTGSPTAAIALETALGAAPDGVHAVHLGAATVAKDFLRRLAVRRLAGPDRLGPFGRQGIERNRLLRVRHRVNYKITAWLSPIAGTGWCFWSSSLDARCAITGVLPARALWGSTPATTSRSPRRLRITRCCPCSRS